MLTLHPCKNFVKITDPHTGEVVCNTCGTVLGHHYASGRRKRKESESSGSPSTLQLADRGLSTVIGSRTDHSGKAIPASSQARIKRLRLLDSRTKSGTTSNRNLRRGLLLIEKIAEKLGVTKNASEEASYIFRKAHAQKLSKGRSLDTLAVACLYASCRANNIPRNLTEFSRAGHIDRSNLSKMYRLVNKEMNIKFKPFDPHGFVSKLANKLGVDERAKRKALNLIHSAEERKVLSGKRPASIAAAAIYAVCKSRRPRISLRKIAQASRVSVNTIRKISETL